MSSAVTGYVAGVLVIAFIDGLFTFIVLEILGVPFAVPLAVMMGTFSLIPLVGATIGAVLVGIVTVFADFPTDTIAWVIWAIVYQQIENNLLQPQIQRRTVQVHPLLVLVIGAVRRDAAGSAGRAGRDPDRSVHPDPGQGLVGLPPGVTASPAAAAPAA